MLAGHSIITYSITKKCLLKMEEQQQKIYRRNTLVIKRIYSNPKLFATSCSRFGPKGQWEYNVTTVLNNEPLAPLPRLMNDARSIMAMNECIKTCQLYYNNPEQKQRYKPNTFQIKLDCNQKIGTLTCPRYDEAGKCQCIVRTVFANTTKQPLTGHQIEESSIKAMFECTKLYYNTLNNKNLAKQVKLEKIIRKIKAHK